MDTLFPYTTRFRSVSWRDPDPVSSWQRHLSSPLPSPVRSGRPKGNYLSPRGYGETGRTERYGCRNIDCGGRSPRIVRDIRRGHRIGPSSRSEEHTSELQSLMRISYAVFCLKQQKEGHKTKTVITQEIAKI